MKKYHMWIAVAAVCLLSGIVWYKEQQEEILQQPGQLIRQENGSGEYEAELVLEIDGTKEIEWLVTVPEQSLTQEEEQFFLEAAINEIEMEFLGENESFEEVFGSVVIRDSYQNGKVEAEWSFYESGLIQTDGSICEEKMEAEMETVNASVCLSCEDSSLIYEFSFLVWKKEKSTEEQFYETLNQLILESSKEEGTEYLTLPSEAKGHTLLWKTKQSNLPIQVFLLGMVVVILLPALQKEKEKELKKKRDEQLMLEYPVMVNKLSLLLGAGMTLRGAWKLITEKYRKELERNKQKQSVVYEEMLIAQREIESGKSELAVYEEFGERCGLQSYRKLANYLIQNARKGNQGLCQLLEKEVEDAFRERKNLAQKLSEEVGTKLLLPMFLMLGIVIILIMIPAMLSFQSGMS